MLTHQTVGGRANDGGLRIGEMERDGVIAHGAARFLQESMLTRGDEYYMAVCNNTGTVAIYNNSQKLFLSPMADGPIKFNTTIDDGLNIENVSKYGRQFSILRIPYAFKLLIQELQTMNIQMRLITEDNIDQLTSMSYSNNILKLQKDDTILNTESRLKIAITNEITNRIDIIVRNEPTNLDMTVSDKLNEPSEKPIEQTEQDEPLEPESYGWTYYSYDEERGEAYKSLILNNKGDTSEIWFVGENDGQLPNRYPAGWNINSLLYNDKTPIMPNVMIEELSNTQEPNNWNISLDAIRREEKGKIFMLGTPIVSHYVSPSMPNGNAQDYSSGSPEYNPNSPPYAPRGNTPEYNPNSPPYAPRGNTPEYNPNSPPYAPRGNTPEYNLNSPPYAPRGNTPDVWPNSPDYPPPQSSHIDEGRQVIVLDSQNPVVIMPQNTSIQNSSSSSSHVNNQIGVPLEIETDDMNETENIGKMIEQTKPKRDDGIELIINTDPVMEENKEEENKDNNEKKTIKLG
jgi:hypothetical protein